MFLGGGFNVVVLGSGGESGGRYCHVQIHHDKSGSEIELHGVFEELFVQEAFMAAHQIKLQARKAADLKSQAGRFPVIRPNPRNVAAPHSA